MWEVLSSPSTPVSSAADAFKQRLNELGIKVYTPLQYSEGYPSNIPLIVSDEGYGKNDYIETTRPLVVITAPGPGSGKMAACLSQLYHEHKRGIRGRLRQIRNLPDLESSPETSGKPGL